LDKNWSLVLNRGKNYSYIHHNSLAYYKVEICDKIFRSTWMGGGGNKEEVGNLKIEKLQFFVPTLLTCIRVDILCGEGEPYKKSSLISWPK
jgi:hypothetical protein